MSYPDIDKRFSARIKNLFIELHDYAYFHSPSEIGHLDRRFTGRRKVLDRLKSLLSDYETPSGAYLVTGYRGAGKSSLVARALTEVGYHRRPNPRFIRYVRAALIAVLAGLFADVLVSAPTLWALGLSAAGLLFAHLLTDPSLSLPSGGRADRSNGDRARAILRVLGQAFLLQPRPSPRDRGRNLLCDMFLLALYLMAVASLLRASGEPNLKPFVATAMAVLLAYMVLNGLALVLKRSFRSGTTLGAWLLRTCKAVWADLDAFVSQRFLSAPRLYLRINLSQDDLSERDILRLIARHLEIAYEGFTSRATHNVTTRFLVPLALFGVVLAAYNSGIAVSFNQGIRRDSHLACYFPSQGAFFLPDKADGYIVAIDEVSEGELMTPSVLRARLAERSGKPTNGHLFVHDEDRESLSGLVQAFTITATGYLDTFVQDLARRIYKLLPEIVRGVRLPNLLGAAGVKDHTLFSPVIDYLFLAYFALAWLAFRLFLRWTPLSRLSHREIRRRLSALNERIEAQVTSVKGGLPVQSGPLLMVSFGRRKTKTSTVLTGKDIERNLLEILKRIEQMPRLASRPEIIVIFDELDKIQRHENYTLTEQEAESETPPQASVRPLETDRHRQKHILSLVSNLKLFLTTAPAKFIFIAGREMFDAALADVSDRHFFMGSVFNEVVHVPSFLSDDSDDRLSDITSLTEQYLCRFLLPPDRHGDELSLRSYAGYLATNVKPGSDPETKAVREKALHELQNFITYVTYRSNGAPKKITRIIERYLVRMTPELERHHDSCCIGLSKGSFYLKFGYYDQYTFGLVTYLASPLIFSLNRAIKDYGDKILVSSSFLLDNVYKFHGHGFSWRNLELLPEIVDINRAPQLRDLIARIMRFLTESDIARIASGLYDFKFRKQITEEISLLSKVSELESAAFNFTLDESLAIKRHFRLRLKELLLEHGRVSADRGSDDHASADPTSRFVNSIAFVRMILGDLHYFDGELDAAIIEYMEAVQALRELPASQARVDTVVLMTRNFLKLGLAFEQKRSYDSARVTYGRIASMITAVRHRVFAVQKNGQPIHSNGGDADAERTPPEDSHYQRSIMDSSRILLQPMLAAFQLTEKVAQVGITWKDIEALKKSFFSEREESAGRNDQLLITAQFYNKLGDVLFFKNGPPLTASMTPYCHRRGAACAPRPAPEGCARPLSQCFSPCAACASMNTALEKLRGDDPSEPGGFGPLIVLRDVAAARGQRVGEAHLLESARTLSGLGNVYLACAPRPSRLRPGLLRAVVGVVKSGLRSGTVTPRLGADLDALGRFFSVLPGGAASAHKLEEAVCSFACAALVFRWSANSRACSLELTKILWVLRECFAVQGFAEHARGEAEAREEVCVATDELSKLALAENFRSHEGTHRLEIEKLKEAFEIGDRPRPFDDLVNLGRLSINSSTTEILVLVDEIRAALAPRGEVLPLDKRCTPYAMFLSVFSRIHALRLRSRIHFHNLRALGLVRPPGEDQAGSLGAFVDRQLFEDEQDLAREAEALEAAISRVDFRTQTMFPGYSRLGEDLPAKLEVLEFVIADAIYCNHEIVRFMDIYGSSYMASHSMKAAAHEHLSTWCDLYYSYLRFHEGRRLAKKKLGGEVRVADIYAAFAARLGQLVGKANLVELTPKYHAELARQHYASALEAHQGGKAYRDLNEKMHYLNDDFADQLEQFCAGLERFRVHAGVIESRLAGIEERLEWTNVYDPSRYADAGWARAEA